LELADLQTHSQSAIFYIVATYLSNGLRSAPTSRTHYRSYAGGYDAKRLPLCVFFDGTRLECPTVRQISEKLGLFLNPSRSEYDLAICGAGPAGLSAPVYGASEGLKTVVVERFAVGGQASTSPKIENYLGFPGGISGADLALRAQEQACHFGAEILLLREGVRGEFKANSIFLMNIVSAAPAFTTVEARARRRSASQQITFSLSGRQLRGAGRHALLPLRRKSNDGRARQLAEEVCVSVPD
jgi:hypothetical protein